MSKRAQSFDEFIGQDKLKTQLDLALQSAIRRNDVIDHVLLTGPAGMGKTTIAHIIANTLGTRCIETIANVLRKPSDIVTSVVNMRRGDVLFIDEIHALPIPVQEYLYTAMEDQKINTIASRTKRAASIQLHKFILIGATTIEGMLTGPLLTRFGIIGNIRVYKQNDLEEIVDNACAEMGIEIDPEARAMIADRCRATPRIALNHIRRIRDSAVVIDDPDKITVVAAEHAYSVLGITRHGLTEPDRKVLQALGGYRHAVGLETLAGLIHADMSTIQHNIEPHLMRLGLIQRTPKGRILTDYGHRVCQEIEG